MSNTSKIEWTDATWNPVTGCTKVSQGCKNCYAERMYERFNGKGSFKTITCHDDRLEIPLHWKKPRMVFVNSMSDLFHKEVGFNFIYKVFEMMHLAKQHTFQVLTKRADRLEILNDVYFHLQRNYPGAHFPLSNVWIGISCEDQATADERIPFLLNTPAAVRFLSCEPLLGPIDLYNQVTITTASGVVIEEVYLESIDWVITGGESGPGARPMHPDWVRSIRDQCKAAGVAFFFKQWGEWCEPFLPDEFERAKFICNDGTILNPDQDDCSNCKLMVKVGKKSAGNILDASEHLEFPVEPQKEQKKTKENI